MRTAVVQARSDGGQTREGTVDLDSEDSLQRRPAAQFQVSVGKGELREDCPVLAQVSRMEWPSAETGKARWSRFWMCEASSRVLDMLSVKCSLDI